MARRARSTMKAGGTSKVVASLVTFASVSAHVFR